tara:strand:- start:7 stop:1419 length:1413 start_codon:yes stop_codon:yes gene_type:complete
MKHYHIFDTFYKGYPIPNGSDFGKLHGDYLKYSLTDVNKWYTEKNGQTFPVCLSDNDMIDAILDAEKISIYDIEDKNFKGTFIYQLHMFGGEGNSFPDKIDEPSILHSISKKALEYIRSGKVKFIINYFIEGVFNYHHFNIMHKHLEELKIPSEKVYFIFGGFNTKNWYESFCKNYNIQNKINIVELSWVRLHKFEEFFHMALDLEKNKSLQNEYIVEKKEYDFLCYNRRLRLHRELFLAFLKRYDLLEKNLVSYDYTFSENQSKVNDFDRFKHHDVWPYVRFMRGEFDFLWNQKPKQTVDVEDVSCIWGGTIESEWKEPYRNSMFSIVTETSLRNTEYYVSEKIFKPIGQKHPFLVVGSHLSLKELRSWGFKTFEPYINESYDNEPNHFRRLEMVLQETKRLCNLSDDEKIKFMKHIEPIVKYNWNHLIYLFKNNYSWLEDKMREIGFEFESKEYVSPHPLDRESILWK